MELLAARRRRLCHHRSGDQFVPFEDAVDWRTFRTISNASARKGHSMRPFKTMVLVKRACAIRQVRAV
jgi:hypothetical protein